MGNGARVVGGCEELRKDFFFFLSSHTSSLEENSRTTKCPGGIRKHRSNRNVTTICKSSGSVSLTLFQRLGPTPAIQTRSGIGPRFGPRPRPGLASGCESEKARPVEECGPAGLPAQLSGCKIQPVGVLTRENQLF